MSCLRTALVVGLGGVTNGGKTTMCHLLERLFSSNKYNFRVKSLHMDDYYRSEDDPHHIYLEEFNHHDWDCLNALDINRFIDDYQSFRSKYDLLFVEGFLIFNIPLLYKAHYRFDLAYYFDMSYDECRQRRLKRNYNPPDPIGYFEGHVWNVYVKNKKEAFEQNKDLKLKIVDTTKESFEKIQETIINDIEMILKTS